MSEGTSCFDEMLSADGSVRSAYKGYGEWYHRQDPGLMRGHARCGRACRVPSQSATRNTGNQPTLSLA